MIIDFLDNILAKTAMAAGEAIDSLDKRTNNKDDEELKNLLNQSLYAILCKLPSSQMAA